MLFNVIVVLLMIAATTMLITVAFRSDPQKSQDHHEAQEDPHSHTPVAPHEPPLSQEDLAASINALQQRFCSAPATERNLAVKDNFSLAPSAVLDLEQLGIEHSHAIELIAQASSTIQTERHIAVYADNFSFCLLPTALRCSTRTKKALQNQQQNLLIDAPMRLFPHVKHRNLRADPCPKIQKNSF